MHGKLRKKALDEALSVTDGEHSSLTFKQMADKWFSLQREGWKATHARSVEARLKADLYPRLGKQLLKEIRPRDLQEALMAVQQRGAIEVAHRLRQYATAIFDCAIALDLTDTNPASSLAHALKPMVSRRYPALLQIEPLRAMIRAYESEPGQPAAKLASRLLALTAVRPGTARLAKVSDFEGLDSPEPIWRIPAAKINLELAESEQDAIDFIVPLSRQTVELLQVAIVYAGGREYLFPPVQHSHRPINENALSQAYSRLPGYGGKHVPHGWRSSFATIMNERAASLEQPSDRTIIDLMLAHRPSGVEASYNGAPYMRRRREIAQEWADLLCMGLKGPAELVEGPRKRG